MKKIWTPKISDILPESVLRDPKLRASAEAIDIELAKLSWLTREVLHLPRLDELSGKILDHLAAQFHVDFYEPLHLDDATKRELIRNSIAWHRIKGTPAAVEQIANTVFADAKVSEWFEYGGLPYHFKITTNGYKETPDGWATFLRMLEVAKNVRSTLDDITLDYSTHVEPVEIFAGVAEAWQGHQLFGLPAPEKIIVARPKAGVGLGVEGHQEISLALPSLLFNNRRKSYVGQILIHAGEIIIDADARDFPDKSHIIESPIADLLIADIGLPRLGELTATIETFEKYQQAKIFAGVGLEVTGNKIFDMSRPRDEEAKLFAGTALSFDGTIDIGADMTREFFHETKIYTGAIELVSGMITIGSETKPTIPSDVREMAIVDDLKLHAGAAVDVTGKIDLGLPAQLIVEKHQTKIRAGGAMVLSGTVTIFPAANQEIPDDIIDFLDGEYLRLYFDFPTGRDKPVLLQNPRGDVYVAEVKAIGDFADENNLFLNSKAEDTIGINRADLIHSLKLTAAESNATIPTGDSLRLLFDFPTGNKRRILLHNIRRGITAGELRELGQKTADNKLLYNAYGETTTGISHVAVIKTFVISDETADTLIKF